MKTKPIAALKTIIKLLDGSQPKDVPGAIMVAQSAIKSNPDSGCWLPIETAPTVGRDLILIKSPACEFPNVAYSNSWWKSGWSHGLKPTHWMPIPRSND